LSNEEKPHFDLIVATHVDLDHIGGLLRLFETGEPAISFGDIWFNGYIHMKPYLSDLLGGSGSQVITAGARTLQDDLLGPAQGDALAKLVEHGPWNEAFGRKAVVVPNSGPLPRRELPGGLSLTVLSPTPATLEKMAGVWKEDVTKLEEQLRDAKRTDSHFVDTSDLLGGELDVRALAQEREVADRAAANGSSIALLAEHAGRSILLAADAWPDVLADSIRKLLKERGERKLKVDAVKLAHHGSKKNITNELLGLLDTENFLISTNGSQHGHPDAQAIARIVMHREGVRLHFNSASSFTMPWMSPALQRQHRFSTVYPDSDSAPLVFSPVKQATQAGEP
jgi:hypothetical protein